MVAAHKLPPVTDPQVLAVIDKLERLREVLALRKKARDEVEKSLAAIAKQVVNVNTLLAELETPREHLRKIETRLMELRVERTLGTPLPREGSGVEAKLDKLIREVEELRAEVKRLREAKQP